MDAFPTRIAAPVEQEWGVGLFVGLSLSAVIMILCGTVMFDLVKNMWYADVAGMNPLTSTLLDTFRNMFG